MSNPVGIAIAGLGGYAVHEDALARGIARLEAAGHIVHNYYDPAQKYQRFAGTDASRLAQLNAAAEDPDVQVVIALRGSYGMSRLLPHIDYRKMADSGKLFVGYSDFTAFQTALMKATGRISFAGPMMCDDFIRDDPVDYTLTQFWGCLRGPVHTVHGSGEGNPVVDVQGKLWGGNLAMLAHVVGTPYFANFSEGILFLEDIGEHPYKVERMMLQLLHAGALEGQQAIVLGDFGGYRLSDADNGYNFNEMLAFLRQRLPMPILTGLPFGHVKTRCTLPFGATAHLQSAGSSFTLTLADYPTL